MKFICTIILMLVTLFIYSQDYNVQKISDTLKKNANVVKRFEEFVLTIKSSSKYTLYEHHVYTILNESASDYSNYKSVYDKFITINYINGILYNKNGKEISHLKKKEWSDRGYSAESGLMTDARYKENNFSYQDYPYTVDYEQEVDNDSTLSFENWYPQSQMDMSVEISKFTIVAPTDYLVRFKEINTSVQPIITQKGDNKIYTWEYKNIPALKDEDLISSFWDYTPAIHFAPSEFEAGGYKGNMNTWENYGRFFNQLIKGKDILPNQLKAKIHLLTDTCKTEKEKVFILYKYLQDNTRYISIQLGIGSFQPFDASYVAEKKYGDCKALSNFMIALLKEAGVVGKYVEIFSGNNPPKFLSDFPSLQSNHVICCVPIKKDTIWLECTSQDLSAGYLSYFTQNRNAILIDESGAKIVHTPTYNSKDNLLVRYVKAKIDLDGNVNADMINEYAGMEQDNLHDWINQATKERMDKHLNYIFNFPTYEILDSKYSEKNGLIPKVIETLKVKLNNYVAISNKRLFIKPFIFNDEISDKLLPQETRQFDFTLSKSFTHIDSFEIIIPKGYKQETTPLNLSIQNQFGKYVSSIKLNGDKLFYYRYREQNRNHFPAKEYNDYVQFCNQIFEADKNKIVLIKTE